MGLQAERILRITSSAWEEKLQLDSFSGREAISELFEFELELSSLDDAIAPADIIGQALGFAVLVGDENERFFHGRVHRFSAGDVDDRGFRHYRARVVPDLWKLTKRFNCRTFASVAVEDIISTLLGEHSISGQTIAATGSGVIECCVQYQESDFDFISRMLEDLGLYYFFKHEKNAHKLVIAKDVGAYGDSGSAVHGVEIGNWQHAWTAISGKHFGRDYDYLTPTNKAVQSEQTTLAAPLALMLDVYEYPVHVGLETGSKSNNADRLNKVRARIEAQEAGHESATGNGTSVHFSAGHKFQFKGHDAASEDSKNWLLVSVTHQAVEAAHAAGGQTGKYDNTFECMPAELPFRPTLHTPRPKIFGLQTAVVVDEAATDPALYGRVRVRFHWQRDDYAANLGWVRVAQTMAGKSYGSQFMPRLGHEVVVSFIDGDPDHPLIVGAVYNADNREPYELGASKSQSGIKTRSYPDGGTDDYNEIWFEDKTGEEILRFHAQKDQLTVVENDQTITVGNDRAETIDHDRSLSVGNDKSEDVTRNKKVNIGEMHDESIGKSMSVSVGENRTITVGKDLSQDVTDNAIYTVGKDSTTTVSGNMTIEVTKDMTFKVTGKRTDTVEKELSVTAKKVQITGQDEVSIISGSAKIVLKKNGDITIEGGKINVKGSGNITIKGSQTAIQ